MKYIKILLLLVLIAAFQSDHLKAAVADLSYAEGQVSYLVKDNTVWQTASLGQELNVGDRLKTASDAKASIRFYSGHIAILGGKSDMVIKVSDADTTSLDMFKGKLRSKVKKLSSKQAYTITTPQAVCAVRGTEFDVDVAKHTQIFVYEGLVEAQEILTGAKLDIPAGMGTMIEPNKKPELSSDMPKEDIQNPDRKNKIKEEAHQEMFEEISRDAVLSRAAEEIKKAEYENGKAMIDAHGNRVRLEEYIVRPQPDQFKYVVLNNRDDRFDFGKIIFTFNDTLPSDLTSVTKNMFITESDLKPELILTDLVSVISNTQDQVNEEAAGGDMLQDSQGLWRQYFASYEFSIKGKDQNRKTLWTRTVTLAGSNYEDIILNTSYLAGSEPTSEYKRPAGEDTFHLYAKDSYADGTWIAADDYLIDDEGNIQTSSELADNFSSELGMTYKDYLSTLNFERTYTSSEFGDRDIDLVFSTKLLLDSGMLSASLED